MFGILEVATGTDGEPNTLFSVLSWLVTLALLLPGLGVAVRRMHDIGKGGGWIFIALVPLVGWVWAIVLLCQPSEPFDNRFGPMPE